MERNDPLASNNPVEGKEDFQLEPASETEEQRRQELNQLTSKLHEGSLTEADQKRMASLVEMEISPAQSILMASQSESFIGPVPHPDLLRRYDQETRRIIVEMAQKEQVHTHSMQTQGLESTVARDKRGQRYGLTIALSGLLVTAWIAQYSPTAAVIIGAIDLVGLVAIFVAPRIFQFRSEVRDPSSSQDDNNLPDS